MPNELVMMLLVCYQSNKLHSGRFMRRPTKHQVMIPILCEETTCRASLMSLIVLRGEVVGACGVGVLGGDMRRSMPLPTMWQLLSRAACFYGPGRIRAVLVNRANINGWVLSQSVNKYISWQGNCGVCCSIHCAFHSVYLQLNICLFVVHDNVLVLFTLWIID